MNYRDNPAYAERFYELEAEYIEARLTIHQGQPLELNHQLRQSLGRVAQKVQEALDDDAISTEDDVARFCADEAKKVLKRNRNYANKNNYAYTLFYLSCLWLSKTETCH